MWECKMEFENDRVEMWRLIPEFFIKKRAG
jgi:hypothetical protein